MPKKSKYRKYGAVIVLGLLFINILIELVGNFVGLPIPDWWAWMVGFVSFIVITGLAYDKSKLKMSGKVATVLLLTGIFVAIGWTLVAGAFEGIALGFIWSGLAPTIYGFLASLMLIAIISALKDVL